MQAVVRYYNWILLVNYYQLIHSIPLDVTFYTSEYPYMVEYVEKVTYG